MSKKLPVLGANELASHVGEGVHTGLRKGSEAESAHVIWKAIFDSEDGAWGDAISYFLHGLRAMYPDGFVYDPNKPDTDPQHVMDVDGVIWSFDRDVRRITRWNSEFKRSDTVVWCDGAYRPLVAKRLPKALENAVMTLDMLREQRGPIHAIEINEQEEL